MTISARKILLGAGAIALVVAAVYSYRYAGDANSGARGRPVESPTSAAGQPQSPGDAKVARTEGGPTPATDRMAPVDRNRWIGAVPDSQPNATPFIDPARLAQAKLELAKNQTYEAIAREVLPTLSIQTHNPVWQLEYEGARQPSPRWSAGGDALSLKGAEGLPNDPGGSVETEPARGPLPAPESGEFGNLHPPAGEIWLRIPAEYSSEHRDIMAQHAALYRVEAGYSGPITVLLWVGGRPYARQQYE